MTTASKLLLSSETALPPKGETTFTRPGDAVRNAPPYTCLSTKQRRTHLACEECSKISFTDCQCSAERRSNALEWRK